MKYYLNIILYNKQKKTRAHAMDKEIRSQIRFYYNLKSQRRNPVLNYIILKGQINKQKQKPGPVRDLQFLYKAIKT